MSSESSSPYISRVSFITVSRSVSSSMANRAGRIALLSLNNEVSPNNMENVSCIGDIGQVFGGSSWSMNYLPAGDFVCCGFHQSNIVAGTPGSLFKLFVHFVSSKTNDNYVPNGGYVLAGGSLVAAVC